MAMASSHELMQQECTKSSKVKEKKSSRSKNVLEGKEEKALRRRIRYFGLEHDRQAKSLTRDLVEMKKCLKGINAHETERKGEMDEWKRTEVTEDRKTTKSKKFVHFEEAHQRGRSKKYSQVQIETQEHFRKDLTKESKTNSNGSLPLRKEFRRDNDIVAAIQRQRSKSTSRDMAAVSENEVMLSLSNISLRRAKDESEPKKAERSNPPKSVSRIQKQSNDGLKSSQGHDQGENKTSCSERKEKTASEYPQTLYRTSKVTCIGLQTGQLKEWRRDSSSRTFYSEQSSRSLPHSRNTRTTLPPLH